MARQRRSSGQPPEGSDPRSVWHEYPDDAEVSDDREWIDDDADPFDGRPLPRRRRRGGRIARALAWVGGAALLMVMGGVLALAAWPRSSAPVPPTVAATAVERDLAAAQTGTIPRDAVDAKEHDADVGSPASEVVAKADDPATAGPAGHLSPPPLPPLPPGLEPAPSRASPPAEAAQPAPERGPAQPDSLPRVVRSLGPPPAPHDSRSSERIMADFLVNSGDRARAETTARAYADWYAAGSAERRYWLGVLRAIRGRP